MPEDLEGLLMRKGGWGSYQGVLRSEKAMGMFYKGHGLWLPRHPATSSFSRLFHCHCLLHAITFCREGGRVSVSTRGGTRSHGVNMLQLILAKK